MDAQRREEWNGGIMELWNNGIVEGWNAGGHYSSFQYSIVPVFHSSNRCSTMPAWNWRQFVDMKAKIIITPKKAVLDPQGKTVQSALAHIGYSDVGAVHVGKYLEIELNGADKEAAR